MVLPKRDEDLALQGITKLTDLREFTLVEAWLAVPTPTEFEYIVEAMKANNRQFKDCNPNKEDLFARDFRSGDTTLDNLLISKMAGSFALLRRITIKELKQRLSRGGLGPTRTALLKETLAKAGIKIPN